MATIYSVSDSLVAVLSSILYPNGTDNSTPIGNFDIAIFQGWPVPQELDATLAAGNAMVSVYPTQIERNVTRGLGEEWSEQIFPGVSHGISTKETKRQDRCFQISIWCATPHQRESLTDLLDSALSNINRLSLADGSTGNMHYSHSFTTDMLEKENIYRYDLYYNIEFPTTLSAVDPVVIANTINKTVL